MAYDVLRAVGADHNLELIFDFLVPTAAAFGESEETAFEMAERRLAEIEGGLEALGRIPHQGTARPHLGAGVRNVTKGRAIYYCEVDDARRTVHVLAVFFGGQDHDARILLKLLTTGS